MNAPLTATQRTLPLFLMAGLLLGMATQGIASITLDSVLIATNASGSWNTATTPSAIAHDATVNLRVVFKMDDGGTKTYYWRHAQATVTIAGTVETVYSWPGCDLTMQWQRVMPQLAPSTNVYNDPWNADYLYYTNVVANIPTGPVDCPHGFSYANPGKVSSLWVAFGVSGAHTCTDKRGVQPRNNATEAGNGAIIEYTHTNVDGTELTVDNDKGVTHYTVAGTYGVVTKYSRGKRDASTVSKLIYDGAEDAYNLGIRDVVTRIVRKSNHSSAYLKVLEGFARVPWVYGSIDWQGRDYLGFDCADLAQAAAYRAGLSTDYDSNAGLLQGRTKIGATGEPYTLVSGVLKDKNGNNATITIGTDMNFGDLVMIDWDGDGAADHTTVLTSGTGALSGGAGLVFAGHTNTTDTGVTYKTMTEEITTGTPKIYLRRGW